MVEIPHVERLVSRQLWIWENERRRSDAESTPALVLGPYVAIDREFGCGGERLAGRLARRLGWRLIRQVAGSDRMTPKARREEIRRLHALAILGRVVFLCGGAAFQLAPESGLRVRLIAPLAQRIRRIARRRGWTNERARRWLAERDGRFQAPELAGWAADPGDPSTCDLVLNRAHSSLEAAEEAIVALLSARHLVNARRN